MALRTRLTTGVPFSGVLCLCLSGTVSAGSGAGRGAPRRFPTDVQTRVQTVWTAPSAAGSTFGAIGDVLVLCYHAVSPAWPAPLSVTPDRLEQQLSGLVRRGYRGATLAQVAESPQPGRRLVVTFDDAYRSVLTLAAPILERLGLPGTVYVPTDWAGRDEPMTWPGIDEWAGGPHEDELLPMSWEELRALGERGWEIGSHTRSHPHLTELGDEELRDELAGSRAECEARLGACATLAYPYGDQDVRVREAARDAGYLAAAALGRSLARGDRFAWPRVGVYHGDDDRRFGLKTSRVARRVRGTRLAAEYFKR